MSTLLCNNMADNCKGSVTAVHWAGLRSRLGPCHVIIKKRWANASFKNNTVILGRWHYCIYGWPIWCLEVRLPFIPSTKPSTKLASSWKGALAKCPPVRLDQGSVRGYSVPSRSYGNIKIWSILDIFRSPPRSELSPVESRVCPSLYQISFCPKFNPV